MSTRLDEGLAALGLALPDEVRSRLTAYAALLLEWNARFNLLSGKVDADALVERHLLDSLALLRIVPRAGVGLDVGAGAGLPGIPLSLACPDLRLTLLEPTGKKANFLRTAATALGLDGLDVQGLRLEALPRTATYDVVLSRATLPPPEWVRRGAPHVRPGGALVAMLARADVAEVTAAASKAGLTLTTEDRFTLPWSGALRVNLLFRR